MTYNKPEVVKLDDAVKAIQGIQKGAPLFRDSVNPSHPLNAQTVTAYEADE